MSEDHPPDRRKHGYADLEEKLDQHVEEINKRLARFIAKTLFAFAILGFTNAIGIFGFGLVLTSQRHTSRDIQKQRFASIVTSCRDQNERHIKTVEKAGDTGLPKVYQAVVLLLVDQLQPYTPDCQAYARTRVKGKF